MVPEIESALSSWPCDLDCRRSCYHMEEFVNDRKILALKTITIDDLAYEQVRNRNIMWRLLESNVTTEALVHLYSLLTPSDRKRVLPGSIFTFTEYIMTYYHFADHFIELMFDRGFVTREEAIRMLRGKYVEEDIAKKLFGDQVSASTAQFCVYKRFGKFILEEAQLQAYEDIVTCGTGNWGVEYGE